MDDTFSSVSLFESYKELRGLFNNMEGNTYSMRHRLVSKDLNKSSPVMAQAIVVYKNKRSFFRSLHEFIANIEVISFVEHNESDEPAFTICIFLTTMNGAYTFAILPSGEMHAITKNGREKITEDIKVVVDYFQNQAKIQFTFLTA